MSMALPSGTELKHYRIVRVLGVGGFGITYFAYDSRSGEHVAIKEYFPAFAMRDAQGMVVPRSVQEREDYVWGLQRFEKEADALAQFNHSYLNRVRDYFASHGTACMVLEYIAGETLAARLRREPRISEAPLRRILFAIADALKTVHQAGFVHRDVKPANIMLRHDGTPVLLDFGAARHTATAKSQTLTTILTPGYSPIEQYDQTLRDAGPWTDLYAFGMVLYRCVTGCSDSQLVDAIARGRALMRGEPDPLAPLTQPFNAKKTRKTAFLPAPEAIHAAPYSLELCAAIDWAIQIPEKKRPADVAAWLNVLHTPVAMNNHAHYFGRRTGIAAAILICSCAGVGVGMALPGLWRPFLASSPVTVKVTPAPISEAPAPIQWTAADAHPGGVNRLLFSADAQWLWSSGADGLVKQWNTQQGGLVKTMRAHGGAITAMDLSTQGLLATASVDLELKIWNLVTQQTLQTVKIPDRAIALAFGDSGLLACAYANGAIVVIDASTAEAASLPQTNDGVQSLRFSPSGKMLVSAHSSGLLRVYDTQERLLLREMREHRSKVTALRYARDGLHFISGDAEGQIAWWQVGRSEPVETITLPHNAAVTALSVDTDGLVFTVAAMDGRVYRWSAGEPRLAEGAQPAPPNLSVATLSADSRWLAYTNGAGGVALRQLQRDGGDVQDALMSRSPGRGESDDVQDALMSRSPGRGESDDVQDALMSRSPGRGESDDATAISRNGY